MDRRKLLVGTAAGLGAAAVEAEAQQSPRGGKQVLELRRYTFASPEKRAAFEKFLETGMAPALARLRLGPVGMFRLTRADNPQEQFPGNPELELYVLIPHPSADSALSLDARLAADSAYGQALGALADPPREPAFARYETSLFVAFDQCPRVETPARGESRVLQLRIYEASNDERCRRKVHMFNEGGELRIFREVGMAPVFFGHAFAGPHLPNMTYMLGFESPDALQAAWAKFRDHPDWVRLRQDPKYRDTVSRITNLIMRPIPGSAV